MEESVNFIPVELRSYLRIVQNFRINNVKIYPVNSTSFSPGDNVLFNLPNANIIDTRSFSPEWDVKLTTDNANAPCAEQFIKNHRVYFSSGQEDSINDYNVLFACVKNWTMSSAHLQTRSTFAGESYEQICWINNITNNPNGGSGQTDAVLDDLETGTRGNTSLMSGGAGYSGFVRRILPQRLVTASNKRIQIGSHLGMLADIGWIDCNFTPSISVNYLMDGNGILGGATTATWSALNCFATISVLNFPSYSESVFALLSSGQDLLRYAYTRWNVINCGVESGSQQNLKFQCNSSCLRRVWLTFRQGTYQTQAALYSDTYIPYFYFADNERTAGYITQTQLYLNNLNVDQYPRARTAVPYENLRSLGKQYANDSDCLVESYHMALNGRYACIYNFEMPGSDSLSQMTGYDTLGVNQNCTLVIDQNAAFNPLTGAFTIALEQTAVLNIGAGKNINISY